MNHNGTLREREMERRMIRQNGTEQ